MARAKIEDAVGLAAIREWVSARDAGESPPRSVTAMAVRYSLQLLAERAPGNSVEVRVPPFGAVQCVEGPGHTRGTPPNLVEMPAATWLELVVGAASWDAAVASGALHASGVRADVSWALPLVRLGE